MKIRNLTTFALILLILLNSLMFFMVYRNYMEENFYDQKTIDNVNLILYENGIRFENKQEYVRKEDSSYLYEEYKKEDYEDFILNFGDKYSYENGTWRVRGKGGLITLTDNNVFVYFRDGFSQGQGLFVDSQSDKTISEKLVYDFLDVENIYGKKSFLNSKSSVSIECLSLKYDVSSKQYYAVVSINLDGKRTDNRLNVVYKDGEILAIDGTIIALNPSTRLNANSVGLLSILLSEKDRIATLNENSMHIIKNIRYGYETLYDIDSNLYLMPVCTIEYDDGNNFTYELISGELITD